MNNMFYINRSQNSFNYKYKWMKTQIDKDTVIQALLRNIENKFRTKNIKSI